MDLLFTKGAGKTDDLLLVRSDGTSEAIVCPKQGMIPHDMVHFAVETVMTHRGFLTLAAAADGPTRRIRGDEAAEAIERLVETMQAAIWSGGALPEDIVALYEVACFARDHAVVPVSVDDVAAIRVEIDGLTVRWAAVPVGGTLRLGFETNM